MNHLLCKLAVLIVVFTSCNAQKEEDLILLLKQKKVTLHSVECFWLNSISGYPGEEAITKAIPVKILTNATDTAGFTAFLVAAENPIAHNHPYAFDEIICRINTGNKSSYWIYVRQHQDTYTNTRFYSLRSGTAEVINPNFLSEHEVKGKYVLIEDIIQSTRGVGGNKIKNNTSVP